MRNYAFDLLMDDQLVGQGFGDGNSAIEAFEEGIEQSSVFLPDGAVVEVVATNTATGLMISFEAGARVK